MDHEGQKCVIYIRVSTEMQVDGYSLEGQKHYIKRYAEREGMIVKDIYEELGRSGKDVENRPAFQKMLKDIASGLAIDYVLVYKLSRFGRNVADTLTSLEFIQSYGVNLIATEEGIDSSQAIGKLLISVLSAVAEIERVNIIEQTMNGRKEKARQGKWNGGFAPYGYDLVNGELKIAEDEAPVIKQIFDLYANTNKGINGVAKELSIQGIRKKVRHNGKLDYWTSHSLKSILDNPVYVGKIAYGRRSKEKIKGTHPYHIVPQNDYIITDGLHEPIITEDIWEKTVAKRKKSGVPCVSSIGHRRTHLLTGILKCPVCGKSMSTTRNHYFDENNVNVGTYYYGCQFSKYARGKTCTYRRTVKKELIEAYILEFIKIIIDDENFAQEIKNKINSKTDTSALAKELETYKKSLKESMHRKNRIENDIDNLPIDSKHYDEMYSDLNTRLYKMYDVISEIQDRIENLTSRMDAVQSEEITIENIYTILKNFNSLYEVMSDEEKKQLLLYLIKRIDIYEDFTRDNIIKSIELNFRIYKNLTLSEKPLNTLDDKSVFVNHIISTPANNEIPIKIDITEEMQKRLYEKIIEIERSKDKKKRGQYNTKMVTYKKIQEYISEKYGFHVHTCYIAQVKRSCGVFMYDAPNAVEQLKHPRPNVPPEKAAAIKEALYHFGVIKES